MLDEYVKEQMKLRGLGSVSFWFSLEKWGLQMISPWDDFKNVIDKAKMACASTGNEPLYHFADVSKMVTLGSDAKRKIDDIALTGYACL